MNIDTIMTRGVSTMKNKLPPFIEIYRALIATPSISATEEALDQSNADLITLLADWFKDLGFNGSAACSVNSQQIQYAGKYRTGGWRLVAGGAYRYGAI